MLSCSIRLLLSHLIADCSPSHPVGIQAAVYALASSFAFLDDELSILRGYDQIKAEDLWAIAHRSYQRALCFSHISCLQLCLLLLQTPAPNPAVSDPLNTWALSCSSVSLAESLGLNLDPLDWKLPLTEIMLRRRLWWLMYSHHIWHAIVLARPSHVNCDNWELSELTVDDFETEKLNDLEFRNFVQRQGSLVIAHCQLAVIAADVLVAF
jgi:hypothetical protein